MKITLIPSESAIYMEHALISRLSTVPSQFKKSITYDNGSVEHVIGLILRFYPKKTDRALLSQSDLDTIQSKLNHHPTKCLDFLSPLSLLCTCCLNVGILKCVPYLFFTETKGLTKHLEHNVGVTFLIIDVFLDTLLFEEVKSE